MKSRSVRFPFAGALGIGLVPVAGAAKPFDACRTSTNVAYDSCTAGAQSDKALRWASVTISWIRARSRRPCGRARRRPRGSFAAGVDGAHPGIIMKAHPAVGDFYRQEFLLNEAEDLAEVLSLSESVTACAGSFDHGLKAKETEAIDPTALENKSYAAGIGNVLTHDLVTGEMLPLVMIKTQ